MKDVFVNFSHKKVIFEGVGNVDKKEEKAFPREVIIPCSIKGVSGGTVTMEIKIDFAGNEHYEQVKEAVKKCCDAVMACF